MVTIGSASARISAGMDGFLLSKSATMVAFAPGARRQVTTGGIALILIPIVTASVVLLAAGQQVGSAFREGTMDARQIVRISVTPRAGVAFRMPIAAAGSRARMEYAVQRPVEMEWQMLGKNVMSQRFPARGEKPATTVHASANLRQQSAVTTTSSRAKPVMMVAQHPGMVAVPPARWKRSAPISWIMIVWEALIARMTIARRMIIG